MAFKLALSFIVNDTGLSSNILVQGENQVTILVSGEDRINILSEDHRLLLNQVSPIPIIKAAFVPDGKMTLAVMTKLWVRLYFLDPGKDVISIEADDEELLQDMTFSVIKPKVNIKRG